MKPESQLARRRRIAARIDDLTEQAKTCARWAAGYRAEAQALRATLAELEGKPLVWDFSPMGECPDCRKSKSSDQCRCAIELIEELPQPRGKEKLHGLPY